MATTTACTFGLREKVFVNVLPSTLSDPEGLAGLMEAVVSDCNLAEGQLVIELVESEQFASKTSLSELVRTLHDKGIGLALDDFGTGFNNFAAMTEAMPDYIKLDQSLQVGLTRDARKWHMVANIIDAAKQNDVLVIAEGVEDEETASALRTAGIDYMQGYLFGYPKEGPVGF